MNDITVLVDADLQDLIPDFLENRRQELSKIAKALEQRDSFALDRLGHNLKGVSGSFGFSGLAELGEQLQHSADAQDWAHIDQLVAQMTDYLTRVRVSFVATD